MRGHGIRHFWCGGVGLTPKFCGNPGLDYGTGLGFVFFVRCTGLALKYTKLNKVNKLLLTHRNLISQSNAN